MYDVKRNRVGTPSSIAQAVHRKGVTMRKHMIAAVFALAAGGMHGQAALAASHYSAVGDLGIRSNPNGPWSYLVSGSKLPLKTNKFGNIQRWVGWYNGQNEPDSAAIARNKTGATVTYLTIVDPVDHLNIDPESNANVTVRFTVPTDGKYELSGDFRGNDTSQVSHRVEIDWHGQAVFSGTIDTYSQLAYFRVRVNASAGDTIDFVTQTGSTWTNLSTGLKARLKGP